MADGRGVNPQVTSAREAMEGTNPQHCFVAWLITSHIFINGLLGYVMISTKPSFVFQKAKMLESSELISVHWPYMAEALLGRRGLVIPYP